MEVFQSVYQCLQLLKNGAFRLLLLFLFFQVGFDTVHIQRILT
jgi:hypothetical protein